MTFKWTVPKDLRLSHEISRDTQTKRLCHFTTEPAYHSATHSYTLTTTTHTSKDYIHIGTRTLPHTVNFSLSSHVFTITTQYTPPCIYSLYFYLHAISSSLPPNTAKSSQFLHAFTITHYTQLSPPTLQTSAAENFLSLPPHTASLLLLLFPRLQDPPTVTWRCRFVHNFVCM